MAYDFRRIAVRALLKPRLLILLIGAAWRFRRRAWYRRAPFLPLPSSDYMRWRLHTAFGNESAAPGAHDLESYLKWAAWMRKPRATIARTDQHWNHF